MSELFLWNQGKIPELPWNQGCFHNAPKIDFVIKVKIDLDFWGKIHELSWNQGKFFEDTRTRFLQLLCA